MRNVDFLVDDDVTLHIRRLEGALEPTREGESPYFDEPSSFALRIDRGEVAMDAPSLTALLNRYVFDEPDAPLGDLELAIEGDKIRQKGTLRKAIPVPFSILAEVSATPDGRIRLHPVEMKAAGLPVKKLADFFDIELDEVIDTHGIAGVTVEDDDLLLTPGKLPPPPEIRGKVTAVRMEGERLVQVFGGGGEGGKGEQLRPSDPDAANTMFFQGGDLRFGKLTMHGADLQLIDADPGDPFAYSLRNNLDQLVAGFSRTQPDDGLVVWVPDYDAVAGGRDLTGSPVLDTR
jgi:hypothetical protein